MIFMFSYFLMEHLYYWFFSKNEFSHAYIFFFLCFIVVGSYIYMGVSADIKTSNYNKKLYETKSQPLQDEE